MKALDIEIRTKTQGWISLPTWVGGPVLPDSEIRIKPTPTLRPWRPEEVPMPCVFRNKSHHGHRSMCLSVATEGVQVACPVQDGISYRQPFSEMLERWEHSLDHGKTWLPCGVLE